MIGKIGNLVGWVLCSLFVILGNVGWFYNNIIKIFIVINNKVMVNNGYIFFIILFIGNNVVNI